MIVSTFVACGAILIALSLSMTPFVEEEPVWIEYEHKKHKNTVHFVGGDGKTMLTGHWYHQSTEELSKRNCSPIVIMAHGLGLVQERGLQGYIDAFTKSGISIFTFDYASFGESDGLPRHQIDPHAHVADLQAAIKMIKNDSNSSQNIGLWGTSLGGGHVLQAAALDNTNTIKAVVAQVPHLASGLESAVLDSFIRAPIVTIRGLGLFFLGLVEWSISTLFRSKPAYYPIVGEPGSAAMMQNPGDRDGYLDLLAPSSNSQVGWKNAATTTSGLKVVFTYRPITKVNSIDQTPTLLLAAEGDTLCPAKYVKLAHDRISGSEFHQFENIGHFDIYKGSAFQVSLQKEVLFFEKHLFG